ncbi:hypothetical protein [Agrococcus jejuensis]|uniref:hypothetical protein n=1 Tax=Agrococcus jejuensis TaxID=399736 RepID=UPI0011A878D0|nr:hypothetical protein [Agrococcus jejuensis]
MPDALHRPDVRAAVACLSAVVAAGLFAMTVMPRDGWWSIAPMVALVATAVVAGAGLLVRAAVQGAPRGQLVAIAVIAAGASVAAVGVAFGAILGAALVLGIPLLLAIVACLALVLTGRGVPPFAPRAPRAIATGAGVSLVLVALGVVDALVWLPETLVPGAAAAEVHAALAAAGAEGSRLAMVFGAAWAASAIVVAAIVRWRRLRPGASFAWTAAPGILAIMGLGWWELGLGMDIADTLMTGGGLSWAMPWLAALACVATGIATFAVLRDRAPVANAAAVTA